MAEYKQISVTPETKVKIDSLKEQFANDGVPMQAPAIVGAAVKMYAESFAKKD